LTIARGVHGSSSGAVGGDIDTIVSVGRPSGRTIRASSVKAPATRRRRRRRAGPLAPGRDGPRQPFEESLLHLRRADDQVNAQAAAASLALALVRAGDNEAATALLRETLAVCRRSGIDWDATGQLDLAAGVLRRRGRPQPAARLHGAGEGLRERHGIPRGAADGHLYRAVIIDARAALGGQAVATAWAEGRPMTLDDAVDMALDELGAS